MADEKKNTKLQLPEPFEEREALKFMLGGDDKAAELADMLIAERGTLAGTLNDYRIDRLDDNTRGIIKVVSDLSTGRLERSTNALKRRIVDTAAAGEFFMNWFQGMATEEMAVLYLDTSRRVIDCRTEARGDETSVSLDVRKVVMTADELGARYMIVAHNHPNTPALPSPNDLAGTTIVAWCLAVMGDRLIDHIVVYKNDFVSFKESGLLSSGNIVLEEMAALAEKEEAARDGER